LLVQGFVDVVSLARLRVVLFLALLVGCDSVDDVDATVDERIPTGIYVGDGGFYVTGDPAYMAGAGDAGVTTGPADGGADGSSVTVSPPASPGCTPADCGPMPASVPTCFDDAPAALECSTYLEGSCEWQFVCGP